MKRRRIAVIGGGITGLAAAYALINHVDQPEVTLFEASSRVGGVIESLDAHPYLIELGPDMFTTRELAALDLCRELGIADELIGTETRRRGAYIVKRGQLVRVPEGMALMAPQQLSSILKTPLLSWPGRLRLVAESVIPRIKSMTDESLESFACRRFGREAYRWLIQPLISGIYTADPTKLSMQATMGEFLEMEQSAGSIIRATQRKHREQRRMAATSISESGVSTGARYGLFLAPRQGMEQLTRSLAKAIGAEKIRLESPIVSLRPQAACSWEVGLSADSKEAFEGVIVATRAFVAGNLIRTCAPELANELQSIPYASTAVAVMVVPREQIAHELDAFGMVVPLAEERQMIAASFANHKFEGRAPEDYVIIRVFIGGACQPSLLERSDQELLELAKRELSELIGLQKNARMEFSHVVRWQEAMPQYHVGHVDRVARIEALTDQLQGCEIAGNAYHGVGIPACITSGQLAARRLMAAFKDDLTNVT